MAQFYTDPDRSSYEYALPDAETFQLTAEEAAVLDEDAVSEAGERFPLMHMNSRERERAIAWIIDEYGIIGGWFYWCCFPGCLPDGPAVGPFKSETSARAAAIEDAAE